MIMDRFAGAPRLMLVSDLDHTMVGFVNASTITSLVIVGRSCTLYKQLRKEKPMLTPDITIMSVGTEITHGVAMVPDDGWEQILNQKWDRDIVREETAKFPQLKLQVETEQRPHKFIFYMEKDKAQEVTKVLSERLESRGLDVKIIYSGGVDFDILPQGAGKGQALAYLLKKFTADGKRPGNTLVCGDSGNDAELFTILEVYGVMVSNAQEELLQWYAENVKNNPKIIHASERCASGIIQAIGHFKLGLDKSPRDVVAFSEEKIEDTHPDHEVVKFYMFYERWRRAEVENSEHYMQNLKDVSHPSGVFVHPSGIEKLLYECIDAMQKCYGDKQGKHFRIWVDRVSIAQIGSDAWLVKFDKWESSGAVYLFSWVLLCCHDCWSALFGFGSNFLEMAAMGSLTLPACH